MNQDLKTFLETKHDQIKVELNKFVLENEKYSKALEESKYSESIRDEIYKSFANKLLRSMGVLPENKRNMNKNTKQQANHILEQFDDHFKTPSAKKCYFNL